MFRRPKGPSRVIHTIDLASLSRPHPKPTEGSWMLVPARAEALAVEKRVPSEAPRSLGPQDRKDPSLKLEQRLVKLMKRVEVQADELDQLRTEALVARDIQPFSSESTLIPGRDRKTGKRHAAAMRSIFDANVALRADLAQEPLNS